MKNILYAIFGLLLIQTKFESMTSWILDGCCILLAFLGLLVEDKYLK
jgi:hypothetical protein